MEGGLMKTLTKINSATQEVIEAQTHPTHILVAGAGEELVEIESDQRPLCGQVKDGKGVRNKRPDEIPVPPVDPVKEKLEQDRLRALDKIAAIANLSKDEADALKEKTKGDVRVGDKSK